VIKQKKRPVSNSRALFFCPLYSKHIKSLTRRRGRKV
jgi:hypothetical protein